MCYARIFRSVLMHAIAWVVQSMGLEKGPFDL
jgi:hypothetical protein